MYLIRSIYFLLYPFITFEFYTLGTHCLAKLFNYFKVIRDLLKPYIVPYWHKMMCVCLYALRDAEKAGHQKYG